MSAAPQPQRAFTVNDALGRGWSVIPVGRNKKPLLPEWTPYQTRRASAAEIAEWEMKKRPAAWAVVTGQISGIVTLDFDTGRAGCETLKRLDLKPHRRTGSGGYHVDFIHPGWRVPTVNSKSKRALGEKWPGLDIRADGGYALFLGANSAGPYRWIGDHEPCSLDLLPRELREFLGLLNPPPDPPAESNGHAPAQPGDVPTSGRLDSSVLIARALQQLGRDGRNNAGFWLCTQLRDNRYSQTEAESLMRDYAACCPSVNSKGQSESYSASEIAATVRQVFQMKPREPWKQDSSCAEKRLTDLGNARRFIEQHGENLRYCHQWGKWLVWDGTRWKLDGTGEIVRLGKRTVEKIWDEAKMQDTPEDQKRFFKWAAASQSEGKIRAMLKLATSEPRVVVEPHQLDADPWLLNCANGMLDLRTSELRAHGREHLCLKQVACDYDQNAECPGWRKFLQQVTAEDEDLEAYLQAAIGYGLTGSTREQCIFVLYGTGANGKSTFLETIRSLFGDYARHADFGSFLARQDSGARNDLARLVGSRLVTATEVERGKRLSEVTVKQITGGDPLTVRYLFQEHFEYTPQFKVFLAANHKPRIPGGEHAIWRRIKVIPFTVTIARKDQDPRLLDKLLRELPGILKWAVEGCSRWREPGLNAPESVNAAGQEYREENDPLTGFVEACCTAENPKAKTSSAELYEAYLRYCSKNKEEPLKKNSFGMHLSERGFHAKREGKDRVRSWIGVQVTPSLSD